MITLDFDEEGAAPSERLPKERVQTLERLLHAHFGERFHGNIHIGYVSDAEIRRLNRMYRQKDATTDVLSFSYLDQPVGKGNQLGDVVISIDQAKRQAEAGDLELELTDLLVHGVLHVLGFDHEEPEDAAEMFPLQDDLVKQLL